ncbi:hypothetical protein ABK249_02655 [Neorhizobium sp. Rsf11]|uniref:Uncharacterized protein n=1 Tax=Neorhizobium phenanthreniclasticum TaxID=3157917 RepID=A0ABV0LW47_9HYPH
MIRKDVSFGMSSDIAAGEYLAYDEDGEEHRLRFPQDPIPPWAKTVQLSPMDYFTMMAIELGSAEKKDKPH